MKSIKKLITIFLVLAIFAPIAFNHNTVNASRASIVSKAYSRIGARYRFGASHSMNQLKNKRQKTFDCSGFVSWVYYQAGHSIGVRTTSSLKRIGRKVSYKNVKPGDILLFFGYSHAAIYVGNGYMIHAGSPRTNVRKVKITSYWKRRLNAVRRVI